MKLIVFARYVLVISFTILLGIPASSLAAHPRARDSVVIHVRIFPKQAEAVPIKTQWNVQATLFRHVDGSNSGRGVGTQSSVANSNGEVTFVLPVHADGANFRQEYGIHCRGGWAYHTGYVGGISASQPGEHNVSINMRRQ